MRFILFYPYNYAGGISTLSHGFTRTCHQAPVDRVGLVFPAGLRLRGIAEAGSRNWKTVKINLLTARYCRTAFTYGKGWAAGLIIRAGRPTQVVQGFLKCLQTLAMARCGKIAL